MADKIRSLFNVDWYNSRYPDVEMSGLEPLDHYLRYGERLGRKPSLDFDPLFYLECYPDIIELRVSPLKHFVTIGRSEGRVGHAKTVEDYKQQLWRREHLSDCLVALESFTENKQSDLARSAAWALARWFAWQEDWHYCVYWLNIYERQPQPKKSWPVIQLLYCEALSRVGEHKKAKERAELLENVFPTYLDVYLLYSNIGLSHIGDLDNNCSSEKILSIRKLRIKAINTIFLNQGLSKVDVLDNSNEISLDTISPVVSNKEDEEQHIKEQAACAGPVVSIIVPVFNAECFLETALRSLALQSYFNVEVLIIDDASTDSTRAIAEKFVSQDSRFKLFCLPYNQGAYSARNYGLKQARGSFITVHDADDWSHPDKIVCQVAAFDEHPEWVANISDMVRCTTDLRFGRWRLPDTPKGGWIYRNTSSLMFKRAVFDALGYWDRVRCTGDTEYLHRIIAAFGKDAFGEVLSGVPLSFCRHQEGSLSQYGPLHLITHEKGVRRDYMRAAKIWHAKAKTPQDLFMPDYPTERPFVAPGLNVIN